MSGNNLHVLFGGKTKKQEETDTAIDASATLAKLIAAYNLELKKQNINCLMRLKLVADFQSSMLLLGANTTD